MHLGGDNLEQQGKLINAIIIMIVSKRNGLYVGLLCFYKGLHVSLTQCCVSPSQEAWEEE